MRLAPVMILTSLTAMTGCAPLGVADQHANLPARLNAIVVRYEQDRREGGMAGVIADVEKCYATATFQVAQYFVLRDCLILDYVGYQTDVTIGRKLWKQALPYYEDNTATARWTKHGMMTKFDTPQRLLGYLRDGAAGVNIELARLTAAPIIVHDMPNSAFGNRF